MLSYSDDRHQSEDPRGGSRISGKGDYMYNGVGVGSLC